MLTLVIEYKFDEGEKVRYFYYLCNKGQCAKKAHLLGDTYNVSDENYVGLISFLLLIILIIH